MQPIISSEELSQKLELLRQTIDTIDYASLQNVIFFNISSFYTFVADMKCPGRPDYSIELLLDEIENYIPLSVSDAALDIFLQTAGAKDEEEVNRLLGLFSARIKMDFLNCVRAAKGIEEWNKLVKSCEFLRQQKENQYVTF